MLYFKITKSEVELSSVLLFVKSEDMDDNSPDVSQIISVTSFCADQMRQGALNYRAQESLKRNFKSLVKMI